jgi:hypothetical protein
MNLTPILTVAMAVVIVSVLLDVPTIVTGAIILGAVYVLARQARPPSHRQTGQRSIYDPAAAPGRPAAETPEGSEPRQ